MQKLQRLQDRMSPLKGKGGETVGQIMTCRQSLNTVAKNYKKEENIGTIHFLRSVFGRN